ncbi:FAH family protein, partial [Acinetobacter baumannii]
ALTTAGEALRVTGIATTLDLARRAIAEQRKLADLAAELAGEPVALDAVRLLLPIDHADPAQVLVAGTGLTHLGSAEGRDKMH